VRFRNEILNRYKFVYDAMDTVSMLEDYNL
jgi:hypothetical protein